MTQVQFNQLMDAKMKLERTEETIIKQQNLINRITAKLHSAPDYQNKFSYYAMTCQMIG